MPFESSWDRFVGGPLRPRVSEPRTAYQRLIKASIEDESTSCTLVGVPQQESGLPLEAGRVLDAPDIVDDYYMNLVSWRPNPELAVLLNNKVYLYTPSQTVKLSSTSHGLYTSVASQRGVLAFANSFGVISIFDIERCRPIRELPHSRNRVVAMDWGDKLMFAVGHDRLVYGHDLRLPESVALVLEGHRGEAVAVASSGDEVVSSGMDCRVIVWDLAMLRTRAILPHETAVKCLCYSPWKKHELATGGGSICRRIRILDTALGHETRQFMISAQICSMLWLRTGRHIAVGTGL
jgi:WD40 repeat protein